MKENIELEIQKTRQQFAANEEKYNNILEYLNSVVYYINENGIITFISNSVLKVLGYKEDEVLGKHFLEFVYEKDVSIAKSMFEKLKTEKKGLEEIRLKSKDGKHKLVKIIHSGVFDESKFIGEMGIVIDITSRQRSKQSLGFQSDLLRGVCDAVFSIQKPNMVDEDEHVKFSRKVIENVLQEVEQGLLEVFDKSTIIFYSHTPDNIINFVSSQGSRLLGFDPGVVKTNWTEFLTDNPVNQNGVELAKKAIETGIPQEPFEIEMTNNNGEFFWYEVRELPIVKEGKTVLVVGSLRDITERKKAEEELHTSQSLLTSALEMASMGHWEYDVVTNTFTFNDQFYKMLRTSVNEVGSYRMTSDEYAERFFYKDDYEILVKEIQNSTKMVDPNYHKELEHRIIFADGEVGTIAVRFNIVKDKNGKTIKTYGVNQDITKRKIAETALMEREEKLAESENFLENIIENIPNMIFVKDAEDLKFVKMNKAGEELLGFAKEELIGKNDYDFFPKDQADFFMGKDREVINSKSYFEIPEEKINTRKYGERILHTKKISIRDNKGNPKYLLGISEDITQRKKEEKELLEAKEKAEEMNRLKSNFLANMSHELRTPMVGILGFAELLMEELYEPRHIEMVSTMLSSGTRLISTLNSILDLSRIEANKQDVKKSRVNLNDVINEVVQLYKIKAESKGLYLKYDFPERDIHFNSDRDLLTKIFSNLIDNAVKYTDQGEIIVKIIIQGTETDKKILVEVSDTGIGIPKEYHDLIFEPFRQISEGYSRKFEGSGLGLSITKKFTELLNGTITFESDKKKGSTFRVAFPITDIKQDNNSLSGHTPVKNEITNIPLTNVNVLLVEDDPSNALVISTYLKDYLKVDHVSDGESAIKNCYLKKYDAVLMDINLKGIDGVETLRQIHEINNHYANVPVIATTAYAMSGDKEKFLSLGFTHYISKPFNRSQLLILLEAIFNDN